MDNLTTRSYGQQYSRKHQWFNKVPPFAHHPPHLQSYIGPQVFQSEINCLPWLQLTQHGQESIPTSSNLALVVCSSLSWIVYSIHLLSLSSFWYCFNSSISVCNVSRRSSIYVSNSSIFSLLLSKIYQCKRNFWPLYTTINRSVIQWRNLTIFYLLR
jgi:hypothetical protein